jgi:hypothetical protein
MADLMKFVQDEIATKRFPSFSAGDTITVLWVKRDEKLELSFKGL